MDDRDRDEAALSAKESARVRRRERERSAKERELMRTGQAKAFKQILDAQARRAAEAGASRAPKADRRERDGSDELDVPPSDRRRPSR